MEWLRSHPYLDALVITGSLLIVGVLVVRTQIGPPPTRTQPNTWEGAGGVYANPVLGGNVSLRGSEPPEPGFRAESVGYIPLTVENAQGSGTAEGSGSFDLDALLSSLTKPATGSGTTPATPGGSDTYSFIPTGLIATTTLIQPRSELQETLYYYGNEVGGLIMSFETQHPDQAAVLKHHMEQQDSPEAIATLKSLGEDFVSLGEAVSALDTVPEQMARAHEALARAYKTLGTKLAAIPDAQGNDALFDAIVAYNASAEDFAKKFVSLALTFQSYGVIFSPGDGGSVFVFPSGEL